MPGAGRLTNAGKADGAGEENTPLARFLLSLVDGGLAGCVFIVPLLMGGRQALGQLVLVSLAVAVAVAWMLRQCLRRESFWRHASVELLLSAGVILLVVQIAPLPQSMLAWLAPHNAEVLPLWSDQGDPSAGLGVWPCLSMTPGATSAALSLFLAYGLLFLVTVQRIRVVEDVERLLRWIALAAVMMAGFGLVQLLGSNGKFFWFYEHPFTGTAKVAKGSFTNRNHFAHFLALGIGPLIWWLQHGLARRRHRHMGTLSRMTGSFQTGRHSSGIRSIALGVVLFAGLLSLSRGGVVAMFAAAAICVAVCYRARTLGVRFVLSLTGVAVLIGTLLAIHGYDQVGDRLETLRSGSIERIDQAGGRRAIWAAVIKAIPDYVLLGAGVGSHREVYPMYLENPPATEYTHAENGYLQVALETGVVGLVLVLAGIGWAVYWSGGGLLMSLRKHRLLPGNEGARSSRLLVCAGAISASLAASILHAFVDFVWYVPACMALVALLAGCACRVWQLAAEETARQVRPGTLPRFVSVAAVLVLVAVGTWMIGTCIGPTLAEPHWDRYRIMAIASSQAEQQRLISSSPYQIDEISLEALTRMSSELEHVVRQDPSNARAHLRLAAAYLRRFDLTQQTAENAMSLADIRDAAAQARTAARHHQQQQREVERWLSRTIRRRGDYLHSALWHTRRGLELCPLQGEGYLYLAELCFLEGPRTEMTRAAYVDQALRVRPFDGAVLFEAGRVAVDRARKMLPLGGTAALDAERTALLAQLLQEGTAYWQRSFHSGRRHQTRLIQALTGRVPVEYFIQTYQPDLHCLRLLHAGYCKLGEPEQIDHLCRLHAELCRAEGRNPQGPDAAKAWLKDQLTQLRSRHLQAARTVAQAQKREEATAAWLEAAWLCGLLGDQDQILQCLQNALRCDANDYRVRRAFGTRLAEQGRFAQAEEHLRWCLRRRPNDQQLQKKVREVVRKKIDNKSRAISHAKAPQLLR